MLYFFIGLILPFIFLKAVKSIKEWRLQSKKPKSIKRNEIKQIKTDIIELKQEILELKTDVHNLLQVNDETEQRTALLFPEKFDIDPSENKTVFIKNGKEKTYETIDWRSR